MALEDDAGIEDAPEVDPPASFEWREGPDIVDAFDYADNYSNEAHREAAFRRLDLEVAIGTRDALADVVDELREFKQIVRRFVDETLIRKTLES